MEKLTHWKTENESREYAGSWDLATLDEKGNQVYINKIVTIISCQEEDVNEYDKPMKNGEYQTKRLFVLRTKELKPMITNATNMTAIEKAVGNGFAATWAGKQIKLTVEEVYKPGTKKADNIKVPALRVSPIPVQMAKCECCGKEITPDVYNGTKAKCGYGVCSAACRDKMLKAQEEEIKKAEELEE